MFAYCNNRPVSMVDNCGRIPEMVNVDPEDDHRELLEKGLAPTGNGGENSTGEHVNYGGTLNNTAIYRYGYTGPEKLVPTSNDVLNSGKSGLSFSTKYAPGAAKTTIGLVNATGVLVAIPDGRTHVSVYPIGATVEEWYNAGPNSIWTQRLLGVVTITQGRSNR